MADSEGTFGSSESLDKTHTLCSSYRPAPSHLPLPTPYSSSSVEPASIIDSRETHTDSLVKTKEYDKYKD